MANEQDKSQFDSEGRKHETGQQSQQPTTGSQDKKPEFGQQGGESATGEAETASGGDTALDTKTDTEATQAQTSETGQQSSSFVGSQGGPGSDDYLRKNENQETAQKPSDSETDIEGSSNS